MCFADVFCRNPGRKNSNISCFSLMMSYRWGWTNRMSGIYDDMRRTANLAWRREVGHLVEKIPKIGLFQKHELDLD